MPHTGERLGKMDAPVWLSQACYLLTHVSHNGGVLKMTGLGWSYLKGEMYKLILNLHNYNGASDL